MSTKASATIAAGWLDLSTFLGLDNKFYDGEEVQTLHSKQIRPSSFFTRISVPLAKSGQVDAAEYKLGKAADFIGNVHATFDTPDITLKEDAKGKYRICLLYTSPSPRD